MLVSTGDLRDYMSSIGLDADQASAAEDILAGLQRDLERYCQRPFERRTVTETIVPDEYGRLWPKVTPVLSVSDPSGLFPGPGNMLGGTYGLEYAFGGAPAPVTVTYVGGLDLEADDLEDVRLAILRAASDEMEVRHDDTLSPSDLEGRRPAPPARRMPGFTAEELAKFDRLRRRTVA